MFGINQHATSRLQAIPRSFKWHHLIYTSEQGKKIQMYILINKEESIGNKYIVMDDMRSKYQSQPDYRLMQERQLSQRIQEQFEYLKSK